MYDKIKNLININMKTTFAQYLQEAVMPKAISEKDLLNSINDGKFTKDGSNLRITRDFYCGGIDMTTLEGAPTSVGGDFYCSFNNLTSLEGGPKEVGGNYYSNTCKLKSLEGAPTKIICRFYCNDNLLSSLKGAPQEVDSDFNCSLNPELVSLEGAPVRIGGNFACIGNSGLISLKNIHTHVHEMTKGYMDFTNTPIMSHVLGLLKIKKLHGVILNNIEVQRIINKYLPEGDIFACQKELIDSGFEEYAQL